MAMGMFAGGMSVDFADVVLIINAFAIAILFGVLYIDEIASASSRVLHALNLFSRFARMRENHRMGVE